MKFLTYLYVILFSVVCSAQTAENAFVYRKGSIYSIMIGHRSQEFEKEIEKAFDEMTVPDRYFDHSLGKKVFYTTEKNLKPKDIDDHLGFVINNHSDVKEMNEYDALLQKQYVASRMIAKWFERKRTTGLSSMQLIQDRGYSNASEVDKRIASLNVRKEALLRDAGEELIGSTFVLVNDINYIDRSRGSSVVGGIISAASQTASIVAGGKTTDSDLGKLISSYKGFNVKIKTYLYQLVWDKEASSLYYNSIYTEVPDEAKKTAFENNRGEFSLIYLGMQESSGSTISFMGIKESEPEKMVRKACQRALDENVANLQKNFDVFKIKVPLLNVSPITCEIGLKEGITAKSRYEVLEVIEDERGHIEYKRVGVIKPVAGKIWDNRFMAVEEGAENATLGYTTFEKVSGGDFYSGMLIREIK